MRKLFGVFVLCALMSAHVCAATGSAHAAAALVSRGIDLAAKASDDFIPVVREEDYSLERLIRKHELTFGEKNSNVALLAEWLGIARGWLSFSWSLPKEVKDVLTCYRIGQHWYGDKFSQVHADCNFLKSVSITSEKNKTTILKRVIAQHIIDVCTEPRLTEDPVYARCKKVMDESSLVEKDALCIYKYFLDKELAAIMGWLHDVLGYTEASNAPDGLRNKYRSLCALINRMQHSLVSIRDTRICIRNLVALENCKRDLCRTSQQVYADLQKSGKIAQPGIRSAVVAGAYALLTAAGGFEKRYEEKAEELAVAWKLSHAEGAATEGFGSISGGGDAPAGPAGAGSGAGAAGTRGPLVRDDAVAPSESSDRARVEESLRALYDLLDAIGATERAAQVLRIKDDDGLVDFLSDVDSKQAVIAHMAEFLNQDDGKAWQFRDFLKRVTDTRVKGYICEVYTTAYNTLGVVRSGELLPDEASTPATPPAPASASGVLEAGPQIPVSPALVASPEAVPVAGSKNNGAANGTLTLLGTSMPDVGGFWGNEDDYGRLLTHRPALEPPALVPAPLAPTPATSEGKTSVLAKNTPLASTPPTPPAPASASGMLEAGPQIPVSPAPEASPEAVPVAEPTALVPVASTPATPPAPASASGMLEAGPQIPVSPAPAASPEAVPVAGQTALVPVASTPATPPAPASASGMLEAGPQIPVSPAPEASPEAVPVAEPKNNGAANGTLTLGGLVTAGSLGYLITELVKSKEVQVVVGRAFKKFLGKKVAPLTFRQRRIAQRLGLHGGVAGAGVIAGLVALIFGSRMRRGCEYESGLFEHKKERCGIE